MTLLYGKVGSSYQVIELRLEKAMERRLGAMGMTKGTKVAILNNKKNGSVIFKIRGTRLAVGKKIADAIVVEGAE